MELITRSTHIWVQVPDEWFKETFESRTANEWKNLSNIYNISGIMFHQIGI